MKKYFQITSWPLAMIAPVPSVTLNSLKNHKHATCHCFCNRCDRQRLRATVAPSTISVVWTVSNDLTSTDIDQNSRPCENQSSKTLAGLIIYGDLFVQCLASNLLVDERMQWLWCPPLDAFSSLQVCIKPGTVSRPPSTQDDFYAIRYCLRGQ